MHTKLIDSRKRMKALMLVLFLTYSFLAPTLLDPRIFNLNNRFNSLSVFGQNRSRKTSLVRVSGNEAKSRDIRKTYNGLISILYWTRMERKSY